MQIDYCITRDWKANHHFTTCWDPAATKYTHLHEISKLKSKAASAAAAMIGQPWRYLLVSYLWQRSHDLWLCGLQDAGCKAQHFPVYYGWGNVVWILVITLKSLDINRSARVPVSAVRPEVSYPQAFWSCRGSSTLKRPLLSFCSCSPFKDFVTTNPILKRISSKRELLVT